MSNFFLSFWDSRSCICELELPKCFIAVDVVDGILLLLV